MFDEVGAGRSADAHSMLKTDDLDGMADMESDQESEVEQPIYSEGVFGVEHLVLGKPL